MANNFDTYRESFGVLNCIVVIDPDEYVGDPPVADDDNGPRRCQKARQLGSVLCSMHYEAYPDVVLPEGVSRECVEDALNDPDVLGHSISTDELH